MGLYFTLKQLASGVPTVKLIIDLIWDVDVSGYRWKVEQYHTQHCGNIHLFQVFTSTENWPDWTDFSDSSVTGANKNHSPKVQLKLFDSNNGF